MFKSKLTISLCAVTAIFIFCAPVLAQPDTLWTRIFGNPSYNDYGNNVQQTIDGGYIVVGSTLSYGAGNCDVYLIKTDSFGNQQFSNTFGGNGTDNGNSVQQTSDGGYIIVGETTSFGAGSIDVYLVKTDSMGNQLWRRTFGGINPDQGKCVQQTTDGGYIIVGYTASFGTNNIYMIKTDSIGNQEWFRTFGGGSGNYIRQTIDGGYIIVGYMDVIGNDVYLLKTDSIGNQIWYKTFGGSGTDQGRCVKQTSDEGYIIVGFTSSYGAGNWDIYMIKTDSHGNQLWYRTYGGSASDFGESIQQTSEGGYVIAGSTSSFGAGGEDVYIIKTDGIGNQLWDCTFGGDDNDLASSIQQTSDSGYIFAGSTAIFGTGSPMDVYLIRLDSEGSLVEDFGNNPPSAFTFYPPSPNPFNNSSTISFTLPSAGEISLKVYDISGREVQSLVISHLSLGTHSVVWDAKDNASGIYFVRLEAGEYVKTEKIVLIK